MSFAAIAAGKLRRGLGWGRCRRLERLIDQSLRDGVGLHRQVFAVADPPVEDRALSDLAADVTTWVEQAMSRTRRPTGSTRWPWAWPVRPPAGTLSPPSRWESFVLPTTTRTAACATRSTSSFGPCLWSGSTRSRRPCISRRRSSPRETWHARPSTATSRSLVEHRHPAGEHRPFQHLPGDRPRNPRARVTVVHDDGDQ